MLKYLRMKTTIESAALQQHHMVTEHMWLLRVPLDVSYSGFLLRTFTLCIEKRIFATFIIFVLLFYKHQQTIFGSNGASTYYCINDACVRLILSHFSALLFPANFCMND